MTVLASAIDLALSRELLDNLHEGVATVDRAGRLGREHSRSLARIVGAAPSGELVWTYFMRVDADFAQSLCFAWEALSDDSWPVDIVLGQLPKTMRAGAERYQLAVTPIYDATGAASRFILVLRNVTAELEREARASTERELGVMLKELARDPHGFIDQLAELDALVATIGTPDLPLSVVSRALHTLKGAAAMLRIDSVSAACHALEESVAERNAPAAATQYDKVRERWLALREPIASLLDGDRQRVEVQRTEVEALARAIGDGESRMLLGARARDLVLERAARRFSRLADHARALASREGKLITIDCDAGDVRVDPGHAAFWAAFVHVVRNAIAHGIEAPAERERAGKPRIGRLSLSCEDDGHTLVVRARDDGRGFDWDGLARAAKERGIELDATHGRDIIQGLSRLGAANDLAGRGEGLHAVYVAARALGGDGAIDSTPDVGTTLTFRVPHGASFKLVPSVPIDVT